MPLSLSLYIHVPFCVKKCRYCDFYSVPYTDFKAAEFLSALALESALYRDDPAVSGVPVDTVFIGGGTPSVLSAARLATLCSFVRGSFNVTQNTEWTVECNPDSFTQDKADVLAGGGVTRITLGMQSLDDRSLALLGRPHNAARCLELLSDARLARFASIGVDLMYGLPGQTPAALETAIGHIAASPFVQHVSAYELTVAGATPFGRHRSLLPLPADDRAAELQATAWNVLEAAGLRQYEVSNFARDGFECRHNQAYWDYRPYLGLGPAAHSFLGGTRHGNVRDLSPYCAMVTAHEFPRAFSETLLPRERALELLFLGLRRTRGIHTAEFEAACGISFADAVDTDALGRYNDAGLIEFAAPYWKPSRRGLLVADAMARELARSITAP